MAAVGSRAWMCAVVVASIGAGSASAWAETSGGCTAQDFAAVVDSSGAALRAFTLEAQPKLQAKIRRYGEVKKLDASRQEEAALDAIQDERLRSLNEKSATMLLDIDTLGRVADGTEPDCSKLEEIKKLSGELLALMREKSAYMLDRLDAKIADAGGGAEKPKTKTAEIPKSAPGATAEKPRAEKPAASKPAAPVQTAPPESWPAKTKPNDAYSPPPIVAEAPPEPSVLPDETEGYAIEEIRDATKGFFGTISTNLATVIEHAFKTWGRPTAYVLGKEGGGAFFAGLRFGEGTLFLRHQAYRQPIYWHGPSLGTDFGAAGSRTMFLIYKLSEPNQLFRTFTGVDGSAYLVGGVGVTLLKGGRVIMAPIRSGLGLRFGANIGYLRFSDHPTWNPF